MVDVTKLKVREFSEADVDSDSVDIRAKLETNEIYKSYSRRGRTKLQIYKVNRPSQVAEMFLMTHLGFINDDRPFMDVMRDGITVDVKTSTVSMIPQVHDILKKMKKRHEEGKLVADYIMCFDIFGDGTYRHVGTFKVKKD